MTENGPFIHIPTAEENAAALAEFFAAQRTMRAEHGAAVVLALPALDRFIATFQHRTGQSHKLRGLLYSLWNGQPHDLSDVLCLDWSLKKDFLQVALAFGYEQPEGPEGPDFTKIPSFFYKEVQNALTAAGQFDWFLQAAPCSASSDL